MLNHCWEGGKSDDGGCFRVRGWPLGAPVPPVESGTISGSTEFTKILLAALIVGRYCEVEDDDDEPDGENPGTSVVGDGRYRVWDDSFLCFESWYPSKRFIHGTLGAMHLLTALYAAERELMNGSTPLVWDHMGDPIRTLQESTSWVEWKRRKDNSKRSRVKRPRDDGEFHFILFKMGC